MHIEKKHFLGQKCLGTHTTRAASKTGLGLELSSEKGLFPYLGTHTDIY